MSSTVICLKVKCRWQSYEEKVNVVGIHMRKQHSYDEKGINVVDSHMKKR